MAYQCLDQGKVQLPLADVERLRGSALAAINELTSKRALLPQHDFTNLLNHYQYIVTMYNNMINTLRYQQDNPYQPCGQNPYQTPHKLVYNRDGTTTTIVKEKDLYSGAEWEEQFKANVLNPPSYMMPPANIWNIQKLKSLNL